MLPQVINLPDGHIELERWTIIKIRQKIFSTRDNAEWPCWFKCTA